LYMSKLNSKTKLTWPFPARYSAGTQCASPCGGLGTAKDTSPILTVVVWDDDEDDDVREISILFVGSSRETRPGARWPRRVRDLLAPISSSWNWLILSY